MATIDSKKLLPPSKESSAIEKQKFLVPVKSISVKKITGSDLKPVDKTETDEPGSLVVVKKKVVSLSKIINNNLLLDQREASAKRKEEEKSKRERKEKDLEKKVKKNNIRPDLIGSIPGQSILDKINRFIGFTLLGYLFNQYAELLPKLMEFGKVLEPVGKFVEGFAKNILKGVVDFVEFGYKAYDQTRDFVKQVGGEGAEKTFDDFSKNLNLLLNGAIGVAMLIASTEPKKSNNLSGKGGGYGVGYAAGYAAGLASGKGIRPGAGFRDPGRYRAKGQARAGGFELEQARKELSRQNSLKPTGPRGPLDGIGRRFRGASAQLETGTLFKRGAGIQKALYNAPGKIKGVMPKGVGKVFGRVPIVGGLIDFAFSLAMGEKPGRAAAKAVGSTVGSALGTFIPVPFAGTILGGILGDIVGGAMYDTLVGGSQKPQAKAQGGTVTRSGQSTAAPSRKLKTKPKKTAPKIQSQKTQPGKDAGGKLKIEELYGTDEPGKRSALRALKKSSEDVKKMSSINGLTGAMFGAGIDMTLGQKPDKKLARSIGDVFGSVVQNAVNAELNNSFGDISKTIAMASGGVVPTREIGSGLSIGERIGKFISNALAISIESSASRIIQNLNRELNLEGEPPGGAPDGGGAGGEGGPDVFHGMGAERMWNFFKNKGLSDFAVSGILGNARWESSFNPTARGKGMGPSGSDAIGIFQWGETERWKDLVNWAKSKNLNPWDYDTQLQFAWHEMQTTEKATIPALQSATSASDAAEKFRSVYERSRNTEQRRKDAAESYYKEYKGKTYIPPTTGVALTETSQFGPRGGGYHYGIDLQNKAGWRQTTHLPVTIKKGGVVEYAGIAGDGNGIVTIRHDDGSKTRYIHLNNFKVRTGQTVGPGTIIGRIAGEGESGYGNSSGPHLHFEYINPQGKTINPKSIYSQYVSLGANIVQSKKSLSQPSPPPKQANKSPTGTPASPPPPGGPKQKLTRTNQWDPSEAGLKFNSKTGTWEKASLAPKSLDVASGLNIVPSYLKEKEINNYVLPIETSVSVV